METTVITADLLLGAYAGGIFPMAEGRHDPRLYWVEPQWRGIIPLDERFHVPRRLVRTIRQRPYLVRADTAFREVMAQCASATADRPGTWINDEIIELYGELHQRGYAHSIECWQEGRLVGGLYGVALGGAFFGESMFTRARDASKIALVYLVERLRRGGFVLLDAQFVTAHLAQFGAEQVSRRRYRALLERALAAPAGFYGAESPAATASSTHSLTQTS